MQKLKKGLVIILMLIGSITSAQRPDLVIAYISTYRELAMNEMLRTGIPASITLAQGIYESSAGTSDLVLASNNHFGIKCKDTWTGESVRHDDDRKGECFRKYPKAEDSYKDHSDFLRTGSRYAFLFMIDPSDYSAWAYGLKKAGYATSPKYPQALIKLIEDYNLQEYTLLALQRKNDPGATATVKNAAADGTAMIPAAVKETVYPEGVFKLNDTKVIYAKQGTSYLSIAKQYEVDYSKIFEYNEIKEKEAVEKDQLVFLQKKNKTGNTAYHLVKQGETLYDISQAEAIRLEQLLELNNLKNGDIPMAGEKLNLKNKALVAPRLAGNNYSSRSPQP
jgi:LysM repeat protein